ncbi:MAG: LysR family transcriptional regulator, partial [Gammaproteobacteria bacterium]|nr:LysR family transcriptional regulator [Gammaproteobacteria bacterium]
MEQSNLSADDLLLFAAVAEQGSVVRAATRLGMPKATVSRRLAQLEEDIGQKLMVRTTRRLVLTEFGAAFLEHSRRVAEDVALTREFAYSQQARPQGVLRVSMPSDYFRHTLCDPVATFIEQFSDIQLDIDLSARQVDIIGEQFDLAIRLGELADDATLVVRKVDEHQFGLYASPVYLARHGAPQQPDELSRHAAIAFLAANGQRVTWNLWRNDAHWNYAPVGQIALNSPEAIQSLARRGIGIGVLPVRVVAEDVRARRLVAVLPEWRPPSVP